MNFNIAVREPTPSFKGLSNAKTEKKKFFFFFFFFAYGN